MKNSEYIYGLHAVLALLQKHPEQIINLYVQEGRFDQRMHTILEQAKSLDIPIKHLSRKELDEIAGFGQRHQGVVANCKSVAPTYSEDSLNSLIVNLHSPPFILVLDGVQDPHNLGACLRTADAAGVHMVIAPRDRSVGLTPTVRKVACGAAENVPFIQVTNLARTLRMLKEQGIWVYGMAGEASDSIFDINLQGPLALVLGAEGAGLRRLSKELCDGLLAIPMLGNVASLNVSVATGICLYECLRQRSIAK